jgi:hypothetical protein
MLEFLIFLSLSFSASSYYVFSNPSTVTVQFPLYSQPILQKSYSISDPNPIDAGANWIWVNGTSRSATFEILFYGISVGSAYLYMKANNTYYVYINGVSISSGTKYTAANIYLPFSCGLNNLTITVENNDISATSSGLNFRISVPDSPWINCNTNSYYSYPSCTC